MKFDELDQKMRLFETANDSVILPQIYMVARIDGRCFTKLTKEIHNFDVPFDLKFRDMMVETVKHLMECGFKIIYGYTQSDEISLLFDLDDNTFSRKERKLNSVLAGEASAKFSLLLGSLAIFDCRISQLPSKRLVVDYFRWRNEDANRNSLNSHCYWCARKEGLSARNATSMFAHMSIANKNEYLFQRGINYNNLPSWQKRGTGIYWQNYVKQGVNPKTGETIPTSRKRLFVDYELPMKEDYSEFIDRILSSL